MLQEFLGALPAPGGGASIRGELNRRQEMLRDAGNYANIHDYEKARAAGAALQPIPSLVLVIDEF
ncbi:hypothetical protein ACWEPR_36525, partial [Streptomyces sp. NPDC004290]